MVRKIVKVKGHYKTVNGKRIYVKPHVREISGASRSAGYGGQGAWGDSFQGITYEESDEEIAKSYGIPMKEYEQLKKKYGEVLEHEHLMVAAKKHVSKERYDFLKSLI